MELLASLFKKGEKVEARERADEVVIKLQSALNELSRPLSGASARQGVARRNSASCLLSRTECGHGRCLRRRGRTSAAATHCRRLIQRKQRLRSGVHDAAVRRVAA